MSNIPLSDSEPTSIPRFSNCSSTPYICGPVRLIMMKIEGELNRARRALRIGRSAIYGLVLMEANGFSVGDDISSESIGVRHYRRKIKKLEDQIMEDKKVQESVSQKWKDANRNLRSSFVFKFSKKPNKTETYVSPEDTQFVSVVIGQNEAGETETY